MLRPRFLQQRSQSFTSKIPLRVVLVVPFVFQVAVAVGLAGYLSHRNSTTVGLGLAAIGLAVGFSVLTSRWVIRPLRRLSQASREIASGTLNQQVNSTWIQEVDILATAFNQMSREIQQSRIQLEDYARSLEQKVSERTQALEQEIRISQASLTAWQLAEEKYRSIYENAPDGIFLCTPEGRYLSVNPMMAQICGYASPEDLLREQPLLRDRMYVDAGCRVELLRILEQENHIGNFETQIYRQSGEIIWIAITATAFHDPQGDLIYYEGFVKDISDRKRAEQALRDSEQRFRATFNQAAVGLAHLDQDGRWLLVNQRLCDIVGYTPGELLERNFQTLSHPDDLQAELEQNQQLLAGHIPSYALEKRYRRKDGSTVWVNLTVSLVYNASTNTQYFISVIEDISDRKQTELALQEREAMLRSIGDNLPDGWIYQIAREQDGRDRFYYLSAGVERLAEVSPEAVLADAHLLYDQIVPEDLVKLQQAIQESGQNLSILDVQVRNRTPSGKLRWFHLRAAPRQLTDGRILWDGISVDITDLMQVEAELRIANAEMRALFTAMEDLIFVFDHQGRYLKIPTADNQLLYRPPEELTGRTLHDILPRSLADRLLAQIQKSLASHQTVDAEYSLTLNGQEIWFDARISPIDSDSVVWLVRNVTERKQAEWDLQAAKQAADAASRAKSDFLANMSHELRSPLNAILGFAQLMSRSQNLSPEQQENVDIIIRSGEHLLTLINNILDLSKIEAGRITLNEADFDLNQLLNDLKTMFRLGTQEKQLRLVFDCDPNVPRYIRTDQIKLRQVLINLLSNAIKFTPQGGVTLRVRADDGVSEGDRDASASSNASDRFLFFEVEDTGIGMYPEELDGLFEAFVQAGSGVMLQEGTGLGLVISRQFVRLMQGDVSVNSQKGQGTLFRFHIRVKPITTPVVAPKPRFPRVIGLAPDQSNYRILVVDDKLANRQLLSKLLSPLGFDIKEASNGKEAIAIWAEWDPHLIWMDMRMPIMDGYEATQYIKAATKGQATAIIALTASALEEERTVVLSSGCDGFVRKPFQESEIFVAMQEQIGVRYLYADSEVTNDETVTAEEHDPLAANALHLVPPTWISEFQQALRIADLDLAYTLLEAIAGDHPVLVNTFRTYLKHFDYERIFAAMPALPPSGVE